MVEIYLHAILNGPDLWILTCKFWLANSDLHLYDLCLQNLISKMKRDMKELEDQAAASARSAQSEKEHSLQLEKDLGILAAELEQVKKE